MDYERNKEGENMKRLMIKTEISCLENGRSKENSIIYFEY
jgi:hypothetical protein